MMVIDDDSTAEETLVSDFDSKINRFRCLSCINTDCYDPSKLTFCNKAIKCWKSITRDANGYVKVQRNCIEDPQQISICNPSKPEISHTEVGSYTINCCVGELCNNGSFPSLPEVQIDNEAVASQDQYNYLVKLTLAIVGPLFFLGILTLIVVLYMRRKHKNRLIAARSSSFDLDDVYSGDIVIRTNTAVGDSTLKEYLEQSITSGSGYGLPLLMQRTLAKQITLKKLIGKGKYGEVWKGVRNDGDIAVKIFLSKDEASWSRETEIYNAVLLYKHPNILCFIGSDMTSRNSTTQLWLVTDYHSPGSLYDYLNSNTINYNQMFKFLCSIVNGINHLHEEIYGVYDKPAIAHRDIKSKNILVKTDGECVIADFGLAVTYYEKKNEMTVTPNPRVGTKRYMAPEILDQMMNTSSFESYKRADIYSLALVFWEVCWRTVSMGIVEDYKPPFHEYVDSDPSFDVMRKVVCIDQKRPVIPNRWTSDSVINFIMKITKECWHQKASVRPSSLRIKKTLQKLNL